MALVLSVGCKDSRDPIDPDKGDGGGDRDAQIVGPDGGGMDHDGGTPDGGQPGDAGGGGGTFSASASAIDFGLSPCGGAAPSSQTITFTNTTSAAIAYTAALSSTSAFAIEGAVNGSKSGSVAAGQTGSLTITAAAVGTGATAGQPITGVLTVTSASLPAPNNVLSLPVSITPQGARLSLDSAGSPSWTLVQRGQVAAPLTVTLLNSGNLAATVQLTQPSKTEFGLYDGSALATSVTIPAASAGTAGALPLRATFAPLIVGPYTSAAGVSVSGAVCHGGGASISSIPFSGAATGTGFTAVATTPLADRVNCGTSGVDLPSATITVDNYSEQALTVDLSMFNGANSPFDLSAPSLTVPSGGNATVQATVKAARVLSSATPGTVLTDLVLLTPPSSSGLSPIPVTLTTTVQGATLSFGEVDTFDNATPLAPHTQTIAIINGGNHPVSPTLALTGANGHFAITQALSPATIPANGPGQGTVLVRFTPTAGDASTQTESLVITPGANDVICGGVPAPLALSGTPSTAGFALQDPAASTVLFGDDGYVDCPLGNAAPPANFTAPSADRTVTFRNSGVTPLTWTARIDSGAFTLDALTGTVPPGQVGSIVITPAPIDYPASTGLNAYGGRLTITTDIVGDSEHFITLSQTARGAVLRMPSHATSLGDVNVIGQSPITPLFSLINEGNHNATVSFTATVSGTAGSGQYAIFNTTASALATATYDQTLAPNGSADYTVSFDPADEFNYNPVLDLVTSTLTVDAITGDPLCDATLDDVVVTARGTSDDVTFSVGANIDLATQSCNVQTNPPTSVVVSNFGALPLDITSVTLADGTWFRAYIGAPSITAAQVPAVMDGTPGTATITIAPKFISTSAGQPVHGTAVGDTLTIASSVGGAPQPDKTIVISQPVHCP